MDGVTILLDGVNRAEYPYLGTPDALREQLLTRLPDGLIVTHSHSDHYDAAFVSDYLQNAAGPILGPADIPFTRGKTVGDVQITAVKSRHIGKTDCTEHLSFILQGTKCVWFTGDASPLQWKGREDLPKPDVLVAPYAYAIGSGWQVTKQLAPKAVVLLHLPDKTDDPYGLWRSVEESVGQDKTPALYIPNIGETICL